MDLLPPIEAAPVAEISEDEEFLRQMALMISWSDLRNDEQHAAQFLTDPAATKRERKLARNLARCCAWIRAESESIRDDRARCRWPDDPAAWVRK